MSSSNKPRVVSLWAHQHCDAELRPYLLSSALHAINKLRVALFVVPNFFLYTTVNFADQLLGFAFHHSNPSAVLTQDS